MLKIFMTGDNHIGLKYASYEQAAVLAESRITAFNYMVDIANKENCGLFVVTGDLFENTYAISKKDVKKVIDILAQFNGVVAILPGNHDYYDPEARVWQYFYDITQTTDNIMLLNTYRPYKININDESLILYPALCTSLHSQEGKNNLDWIKNENIEADATYRLGVAHGAIDGETIDYEGKYFLMYKDELENIAMDAWLIGHTHIPIPRNISEECYINGERIFNAGTHVQTDVSCNTDGACFIIEIDSGTGLKNVRARKVKTGNIRFCRVNIVVSSGNMKAEIENALSKLGDNSVVDVILSGSVSSDEYENRIEIMDEILERFIEGTYNDNSLSKLISKELIAKEFIETSFSASLLNELIENPKEAQLTYELLKSIKEAK